MDHSIHLSARSRDNTGVIVADIARAEAGNKVQVATAVMSLNVCSLSAFDGEIRPILR